MPTNLPVEELRGRLDGFVRYRQEHLRGDEKGEAAIFLENLFRALGHEGVRQAGATLEQRIKKRDNGGTAYADLEWKPRVLVEMKKAGRDLTRDYRQAFEYWIDMVPDRPEFVVLCNFDEFWVYDLNLQLEEPVDRVGLEDLPRRWESLAFTPGVTNGGRFEGTPYFNGGLYAHVTPFDLTTEEVLALGLASAEDWAQVRPVIFGTLFEQSLDKPERHAYGAYFTSEADIQKVVLPSIVRPWRKRIEDADSLEEIGKVEGDMLRYQVLDPACGSGNFLYVAYRELRRRSASCTRRGCRARPSARRTFALVPRLRGAARRDVLPAAGCHGRKSRR